MRAEIYLPKTANAYEHALDVIKRRLSDSYGGYTSFDGTGGWVNSNEELIEEPVTVVVSFGEVSDSGGITELLRDVKSITGEDMVMGAVDGDKILV